MAAKKRGLGRGLDALLGGAGNSKPTEVAEPGQPVAEPTSPSATPTDGDLRNLPVDLIQRGKYQPRRDMQPEALEELAESIKAQGVMQPIVVRPISADKYEIIAGERRWRATQLAGLDSIPAVVRQVPDEAAIAMALIENIQREDLNAMEEAMALSRLQQEFDLTHQEVADAVGKSRATVSNLLRLMTLRDDVQRMLEHGDLEMGHAKALLGLPLEHQSAAANTVVSKGLSVRQTESLVRSRLAELESPKAKKKQAIDPDIQKLQDQLSEKVGVPVTIDHSAKGKGRLVLNYNSLNELDGILNHIK
ncbi:ParB/RepB/Spo0J family partition protein [Oceanicoccus sagamiensis]|uniref:Probable chromosome-partitioning protein ParB n=1 Tax=Oceanicoccus sagamiensis TaxID=716816 RepID=A0A1X9NEL5_9GAMM|nr:ParB/RepB/Spo0J family partition protein [Oceanicoccus sagamiensis]ARN73989.1 chromosome partitioning protein ParB [Oceanicoccus sagamiensis]